jgi:parvulin-like peptidyl-prolyl isomerase
MIYSGSLSGRLGLSDKGSSRVIRWCAVCALLLALGALAGCGGNLPKGVVAKVGLTTITQEQFDSLKAAEEAAARTPDKDSQKAEYARFEQGLAEYLVTIEVLKQKASSFSVAVTDQDVQAEIAKIKDMFDNDEERFNEALKKQNVTLEQLTQSTRDGLLLDRMKAAVATGLSVTTEEAKAYYEGHKSDFVHQEERKTSHILISPFQSNGTTSTSAPTQADWEAAAAQAEKVRGEIQNGADFGSEAKKYSDDITTKESGGELGLITRGQMVPAFEDAVFSLNKGELSQPVRTQYGYHLIEVSDIVPEKQLSYDEASESIKSALLARKQAEAWQSWLVEQKTELGVAYRDGLKPSATTTTTTEAATTSTAQKK